MQEQFNRAVALLHSFAYGAAETEFRNVAQRDPHCVMAHWGMAMTQFRQLWEPPVLPGTASGALEKLKKAEELGAPTERERRFIRAARFIFEDEVSVPYRTRASRYEAEMSMLAAENRKDVEAQVFYALALLANASPADKTHAKQKQAAEILETLDVAYPQHPGIPHYLIHAYDNAELAAKGVRAAKAYVEIAPSAPHAQHMPSHIFTRLGMWQESIDANLAAKAAAHQQGDVGEELHAMDYLVYAYLQSGRDEEAANVIRQLKSMSNLDPGEFKIGYAATAMPVRYAVERGRWEEAAAIVPPTAAPPQVVAIAVWCRGIGLARSGTSRRARIGDRENCKRLRKGCARRTTSTGPRR